MPELDPRRAIIVISGTQGAGKTTVARLLAARFERGAHIAADTLQKMIVSGGAQPHAVTVTADRPEVTGVAGDQLRLRLHNACLLARSFFDAGFTAVLDDIVIGERLAHLREDLRGRDFIFVMLQPSVEAVRDHEGERGTELWREWEWLTESIEHTTPHIGLWLDNSEQTPEQTVDEIMRRAWTEGLVRADAASVPTR